ncbi:MAG: hypothetical protein KDC18_13165 [Alphaproteobacteria bacterium]|nr:hypothetical protein [Alphaproteobacteria bacterium]MCB9929133.1 hypothetical protein [Alphaproteobacteria bacterium]
MPLLGQGMLMTFTEVPDEHEQDFNEWYNREHVDERTQLPGFLRSRRYLACEGTTSPKYVAWYETRSVADLAAPGYLALLADQTPWSKRVMGRFSLFQRLTLKVTVDQIFGFGGALSLIRFPAPEGEDAQAALRTHIESELLPGAVDRSGMTGGCLLENDLDVANAPLRQQGQPVPPGQTVEWLLALEGGESGTVSAVAETVAAELDAATALHYRFVFGTSR